MSTITQQQVDLEIAIIGACLADCTEGYKRIADLITPEMFALEQHRVIFAAIRDTPAPHDMLAVICSLKKSRNLTKAGGQASIARMMELCVGTHNLEAHAGLLTESFQRREAERISQEIEAAITAGDINRAAALGESLSDIGMDAIAPGGDVVAEIDRLIARGFSGATMKAAITWLSGRYRQPAQNLEAIVQDRMIEFDRADDRAATKAEVERIRSAQKSSIALADVLPRQLATPLSQLARWQGLRPECYLFALLPAIGMLQKNGSELLLHKNLNFSVTPNLFAAIAAESSQKKSPVFRTTIGQPFAKLQARLDEQYTAKLEEWKAECKAIAKDDGDADLPPEPVRRLLKFSRATGEAIPVQRNRCPADGLLYAADELKAVFGAQNAYRRGKGSDAEDLLEYYDGESPTVLRVDGVRAEAGAFNLSIVGGIQPDTLRQLMGDGNDSNGSWARFMFVHQPTVASTLPDDDGGAIDVSELLTAIYQRIDNLPELQYELSRDAFRVFQAAYNEFEQLRCGDANQAMRAVWGKSAGRVGKVAINLHLLEWACEPSTATPPITIGANTIRRAISIAKMAAEQIRSLYSGVGDQSASLSPQLAATLDALELKGELSPRDVYTSFGRKFGAKSAEPVRSWFSELDQMGLAKLEISGRSWKLLQLVKFDAISANDAAMMQSIASIESYTEQGLEANDANDAMFRTFDNSSLNSPDQTSDTEKLHHLHQTPETRMVEPKTLMQSTASLTASNSEIASIASMPRRVARSAGLASSATGHPCEWAIEAIENGTAQVRALDGSDRTGSIALADVAEHLRH